MQNRITVDVITFRIGTGLLMTLVDESLTDIKMIFPEKSPVSKSVTLSIGCTSNKNPVSFLVLTPVELTGYYFSRKGHIGFFYLKTAVKALGQGVSNSIGWPVIG